MRCAATVGVFLVAVTTLGAEKAKEETVANPAFKNWSEFKVGTSVTRKESVIDKSGDNPNEIDATAAPPGPNERFLTLKLIEKTPEKVVVQKIITEVELGNMVEHAPVRLIYPARLPKKYADLGHPKSKVEDFKEGDETITVKGKKIECHWVESRIKVGDEESISKVWAASDVVPGGTVKAFTVKKQGGKVLFETTLDLVDLKMP
jgi:hypothetical protein